MPLALSSALVWSQEYTREAIAPTVYAAQSPIEESIEAKIDRIATAHGIATTTLYNLVKSESTFDSKARGKDGEVGLVQIMPDWGFTLEQMEDPEFSLNFAAEKIANGEEYLWVACNCYSYSKILVGKLPKNMDIVPNTNYPRVGGLIVLRYKNNKHIGVVKEVRKEGVLIREANYEPCKIGERLIKWDDPALRGFVDYRE